MLPPPHTRLPSPAPPPPTRTWIFYISASRRPPHLHSVRLILRLSEFASLPHFLAHTHARAPIHKTRPSPRAAQQRTGSRQTVTIATSCRCFFSPFLSSSFIIFFFLMMAVAVPPASLSICSNQPPRAASSGSAVSGWQRSGSCVRVHARVRAYGGCAQVKVDSADQ